MWRAATSDLCPWRQPRQDRPSGDVFFVPLSFVLAANDDDDDDDDDVGNRINKKDSQAVSSCGTEYLSVPLSSFTCLASSTKKNSYLLSAAVLVKLDLSIYCLSIYFYLLAHTHTHDDDCKETNPNPADCDPVPSGVEPFILGPEEDARIRCRLSKQQSFARHFCRRQQHQ
jgi:hypothetical protein